MTTKRACPKSARPLCYVYVIRVLLHHLTCDTIAVVIGICHNVDTWLQAVDLYTVCGMDGGDGCIGHILNLLDGIGIYVYMHLATVYNVANSICHQGYYRGIFRSSAFVMQMYRVSAFIMRFKIMLLHFV